MLIVSYLLCFLPGTMLLYESFKRGNPDIRGEACAKLSREATSGSEANDFEWEDTHCSTPLYFIGEYGKFTCSD